jgi:GDP-L-fucose synthase
MPTNLYGPNDNYDLNTSHVVPALIRKCHEAKLNQSPEVIIWGSGQPRREFLYVDDMADACVRLMEGNPGHGIYNIGMGQDLTIRELAQTIAKVVGYGGQLKFDNSKPDGTPQKLLNIDRIKEFGWQPTTTLVVGLAQAYADFLTKKVFEPVE